MSILRPTDLDSGPLLLSLAVAAALFLGDLFVPSGVAYGVSYTVVILITLSSAERRVTIIAAVVTSVLTILGPFLDPAIGETSLRQIVANRALAIAAIWAIALIIVRHKKTARVLHLNQQDKAAILDSIQTAFIEMDSSGVITSWNPHAELIFGWSREEAIGRTLAETIIPEEFRDAHHRGMQRFLSTGQAKVLDKWIELEGLRRDGTVFPVELLLGVRQRASGGLYFFGFIQDITQRKQNELDLQKSHSALENLSGHLISSHEDERRRLARHIHDDFSQRMAIWTMELAHAEEGAPQAVQEVLQDLRTQAEELAVDLHEMSHRLHPDVLEPLGFVAGIQNECERFEELEGIEVILESDVPVQVPLDIALALYRVVQEGLRNVAKHAQARRVTVALDIVEGRVTLSISDDGVGFTPGSRDAGTHLGLLSMSERARALGGSFTIKSQPGQGTCVEIDVPLPLESATSLQ